MTSLDVLLDDVLLDDVTFIFSIHTMYESVIAIS